MSAARAIRTPPVAANQTDGVEPRSADSANGTRGGVIKYEYKYEYEHCGAEYEYEAARIAES